MEEHPARSFARDRPARATRARKPARVVATHCGWIVFLLALLTACAPIGAQPVASPEDAGPAILLVARPQLVDPVYRQTVLIALPLQGNEHLGIIINRPTSRPLSALFPGHEPSKQVRAPVYFGGPALRRALVALVKAPTHPDEGSLRLLGGLYLVTRGASVDRIIESTPNEARYYLGHVRWRPGELDAELARHLWYVMRADVAMAFRSDAGGLWSELVERAQAMRASAPERIAIARDR
jgi:putative transcriptional regulator